VPLETFIIRFSETSLADANQYAASLADSLKEIDRSIQVQQQRDRPDTQDFGATLAIILGTAAITAITKNLTSSQLTPGNLVGSMHPAF
jgi:hypothetical protein